MRLIYIGLLLAIASCGITDEKKNNEYFNGETYFNQQIESLSKSNKKLNKQLVFNNNTSDNIIVEPNWKLELAPFVEVSLHKKSYTGRFDKTELNGVETYLSNDKKTDIKKYEIEYNSNHTIKKIFIEVADKNNVYQSEKILTYYVDSLFEITGWQNVTALNKTQYTVRGILLP